MAWLEIGGVRRHQDIIQCGSRRGRSDADGVFRFRSRDLLLEEGVRITGFDGQFVVDESATSQTDAQIEWVVEVGGRRLCRVQSGYGDSGRCRIEGGALDVRGGDELLITQRVLRGADRGLWAGIYRGRMRLAVPEALTTSSSSGSLQTRSDESIDTALDTSIIAIRAGDFSGGAAADDLYRQLSGSAHGLRGNAAYNAGIIRYANGLCAGALDAFADSVTAPGDPTQRRVRAEAFAAAEGGCLVPVEDLVGP